MTSYRDTVVKKHTKNEGIQVNVLMAAHSPPARPSPRYSKIFLSTHPFVELKQRLFYLADGPMIRKVDILHEDAHWQLIVNPLLIN